VVARNANEAMAAPTAGSGGVWRTVLFWCVWQESGFGRHEDVFVFNVVCEEILYFQCEWQREYCNKMCYCSAHIKNSRQHRRVMLR
jgi:hypothetical protein